MAIKQYKPTTPTRRWHSVVDGSDLTTDRPTKSLVVTLKRSGGRDGYGHVTSRFRGGGHKRLYRKIDFYRRDKVGVKARVQTVEYDPNRSARISLLRYADGERRYILWPDGLRVGDEIAAAKTIQNFSKKNEGMVILGGLLDQNFVDAATVKRLAMLPGKQELLGQLVRTIQAPVSGFVNVLAANLRGLVQVLQAIKQSKT